VTTRRSAGRATDRELRVVEAVLAAGSEKAAAHRLGLSHSTVKHHLASARAKVGLRRRHSSCGSWRSGCRSPRAKRRRMSSGVLDERLATTRTARTSRRADGEPWLLRMALGITTVLASARMLLAAVEVAMLVVPPCVAGRWPRRNSQPPVDSGPPCAFEQRPATRGVDTVAVDRDKNRRCDRQDLQAAYGLEGPAYSWAVGLSGRGTLRRTVVKEHGGDTVQVAGFVMPPAVWLVVGGAVVWSAALMAGPIIRPDLDLLTAHPEDYAQGAGAIVMQAGYAGAAVAGLGAALLARRRRVAAVLLALFGIGAFAIGVLPPTSSEASGGTLADQLFPYFQLAPLALFPAMVWISWRERRRSLVVFATIAVLLFLPLLGHPPAGGLLNRVADLAIAAWLIAFALTRA